MQLTTNLDTNVRAELIENVIEQSVGLRATLISNNIIVGEHNVIKEAWLQSVFDAYTSIVALAKFEDANFCTCTECEQDWHQKHLDSRTIVFCQTCYLRVQCEVCDIFEACEDTYLTSCYDCRLKLASARGL